MAFDIKTTVRADADSSVITASGKTRHTITDTEKRTFDAGEGAMKRKIKNMQHFDRKPNGVYYDDPTPWSNRFDRYGWTPTVVTLEATDATVTSVDVEGRSLVRQTYHNKTDKTQQYGAKLSKQESTTNSQSWSKSETVSTSQSVNYGVEFKGISVGGETSMSYSKTFGKSGTHSETVTVGSEASVSVSVPAHSTRIAILTSKRGTLNAQVTYQATIGGQVFANYNPTEKGHHFWGPRVSSIYSQAGDSRTQEITQRIEIDYWSDTNITVKKPDDEVVDTVPLHPSRRALVVGDGTEAGRVETDGETAVPDAAE